MRFDGTLSTWNEDRGFGFITSAQGGDEVFVHIHDLPPAARPPRVGLRLSFSIGHNAQGEKRAENVTLADGQMPVRPPTLGAARRASPPLPRRGARWPGRLIGVALLGSVGTFGWHKLSEWRPEVPPVPVPWTRPAPEPSRFSCDGRQHCSQMTSCEEALYFLKNCPDTKMDGDHDGQPCEQGPC